MNRYTVGEIVELDRELAEIIDKSPEVPAPKPQDIAGFDFWPNGELTASATSFASCQHASCRANRVERLARFATMWADSVYLPQYFGIFAEDYDDASWRIIMLGNLRALLTAEPAIRAGILRVSPEGYHLCPSCGPKVSPDFDETSRLLAEAKRSLHDAYIGQVEAQFQATGRNYAVLFVGPEDLLPGGPSRIGIRTPDEPLTWLPQKVREQAESGRDVSYDIPRKRLRESGAFARLIGLIQEDILHQHLACSRQGTKYLTNRRADTVFLDAINDNENFTAWNAVLSQYLQYEMPVLSEVPLRELIELRTKDYDHFLVYRDTMKSVIREHIAGRPAITGKEAAEIYDDVIRPALNKMNQKLRSVRDKLSNKLHRDIKIAGGILAVGLTSGLVAPPAAISAAAAAPFVVSAARKALERSDASDELKSDNLYFLWKASKKSARN